MYILSLLLTPLFYVFALNSKIKATGTVEGLDHPHTQTSWEYQHELMDMDIVIKQEPEELNM